MHQSYHSGYRTSKIHVLICYKASTYSDFLTLCILFCYSGMYGQAVLWPSLPDRAIKKRENCLSLDWDFNLCLWQKIIKWAVCTHCISELSASKNDNTVYRVTLGVVWASSGKLCVGCFTGRAECCVSIFCVQTVHLIIFCLN